MAITVSLSGAADAYTVFERNDYNTEDSDPENDYGDVSGFCTNGTGYTIQYQSDYRGRTYFSDLVNQSPSEDLVIRRVCGEQ